MMVHQRVLLLLVYPFILLQTLQVVVVSRFLKLGGFHSDLLLQLLNLALDSLLRLLL